LTRGHFRATVSLQQKEEDMTRNLKAAAICAAVLAAAPALADGAAKPVMDENTIVMSTQSAVASDWIVPLLLLLLVAVAVSSSDNGMSYAME